MFTATDPTSSALMTVATNVILRCAIGLIVGSVLVRWGLRHVSRSSPSNSAATSTFSPMAAQAVNQYVWTPAPMPATSAAGGATSARFGAATPSFSSTPAGVNHVSSGRRRVHLPLVPILVTLLGAAALIYGANSTVKLAAQLVGPSHSISVPAAIDGHHKVATPAAFKQLDALLTRTTGVSTPGVAYSRDGRSASFLLKTSDHTKAFWDTDTFLSGYTASLTSSGLKASAPTAIPVGTLGGKAECRSVSSAKQPAATVCLWVDNSTLGVIVEPGTNLVSASTRLMKARTAAEH